MKNLSYAQILTRLSAVAFLFATIANSPADPPDVLADTKSASDSPLTLHQVHDKGYANYKTAAATAATNLANNSDLSVDLKSEAASSKHLSELTLDRIAAIESKCDLAYAYSKPLYKGYFQMGADACQDVGIPFSDISDSSQWKKSCEAGRLYLDLNWDRLVKSGASLTDGEKPTLTILYLMHQQGPGAAPILWKHLLDGSAATATASDNMRNNVGPSALAAIDGSGDHQMTELEFYAYWVGSIDAIFDKVNSPSN